MEKVAEKASMDRRMILHYIGKRDDLVDALVIRIVEQFSGSAFQSMLENRSPKSLLPFFFSKSFNEHPKARVVDALRAEVMHSAAIEKAVKQIYDVFLGALELLLSQLAPEAPEASRKKTAFVIMSLAFGGGWMTTIGFTEEQNQTNLMVAQDLIKELQTP